MPETDPDKDIAVDETAVKALMDLDEEIATRLEEIGRTHGILKQLQPEIDARRDRARGDDQRHRLVPAKVLPMGPVRE